MRTTTRQAARKAQSGSAIGTVRATNDDGMGQTVDVDLQAGEAAAGAQHLLPYGISYVPPNGSEVVTIFVGGSRSHPVVLPASNREGRKAGLKPGEMVVHDQAGGREVYLSVGGIRITAPDRVVIEAPEVTVNADRVHLGGEGGKPVARIGDKTSDGATIVEGSSVVRAE